MRRLGLLALLLVGPRVASAQVPAPREYRVAATAGAIVVDGRLEEEQALDVAGGRLSTARLTQGQVLYHLSLRTFVRANNASADRTIHLTRTDRTFFTKVGYAWVR